MKLAGIEVDTSKLLDKQELLDYLTVNGATDRSLANIRDRYHEAFKNELMWRYPISDGKHMGTFIVTVKEGFVSLPFDEADKEDYEQLILEDSSMFDEDAMTFFIDDWVLFSDDLLSAMNDMLKIIKDEGESDVAHMEKSGNFPAV
jgi:hypothetical protein